MTAVQPSPRITVPLDPDRPAPVALAVATQLAEQLHGRLDLVAAPAAASQPA